MSLVSCIVMMSGGVVCAQLFELLSFVCVMLLMFTSSMDMPIARGVLLGLCGVFLSVGASFVLRACVGVVCFVDHMVWFSTCALPPAPACGIAAHTAV